MGGCSLGYFWGFWPYSQIFFFRLSSTLALLVFPFDGGLDSIGAIYKPIVKHNFVMTLGGSQSFWIFLTIAKGSYCVAIKTQAVANQSSTHSKTCDILMRWWFLHGSNNPCRFALSPTFSTFLLLSLLPTIFMALVFPCAKSFHRIGQSTWEWRATWGQETSACFFRLRGMSWISFTVSHGFDPRHSDFLCFAGHRRWAEDFLFHLRLVAPLHCADEFGALVRGENLRGVRNSRLNGCDITGGVEKPIAWSIVGLLRTSFVADDPCLKIFRRTRSCISWKRAFGPSARHQDTSDTSASLQHSKFKRSTSLWIYIPEFHAVLNSIHLLSPSNVMVSSWKRMKTVASSSCSQVTAVMVNSSLDQATQDKEALKAWESARRAKQFLGEQNNFPPQRGGQRFFFWKGIIRCYDLIILCFLFCLNFWFRLDKTWWNRWVCLCRWLLSACQIEGLSNCAHNEQDIITNHHSQQGLPLSTRIPRIDHLKAMFLMLDEAGMLFWHDDWSW